MISFHEMTNYHKKIAEKLAEQHQFYGSRTPSVDLRANLYK